MALQCPVPEGDDVCPTDGTVIDRTRPSIDPLVGAKLGDSEMVRRIGVGFGAVRREGEVMWRLLLLTLLAASSAWAGPTFMNLDAGSPPSDRRSSGGAIQNTGQVDTFVTYGGFNAGTLADLNYYRTPGNSWTAASSTLPARERHALGYDPLHDVFVVVGGASGLTIFDTVFLINGSTLQQSVPPTPSTRPSARIDPLLRWIPAWGKFFYFGGRTSVFANTHVGDAWTLDVSDGGVTWALLPAGATAPPSARGAVCSAVEPSTGRVILFGGEASGLVADTWLFETDGGGWQSPVVTGTPPSPRAFAACSWDTRLNQLVLYGGQSAAGPVGELFSFDPVTRNWTSWTAPSISPGPLSDAAAGYARSLGGTLLFSGRSSGSVYTHETWLLIFNSPPVVTAGPDISRNEAVTATLTGSVMDPESDPTTLTWTQTLGPAVTLSDRAVLNPTFLTPTVFAPTVLRFALSARDATSAPVMAEMQVTVLNNVNEKPIANAGPNMMVPSGSMVGLTGSGSDPNGDPIVGFSWTQTAGPGVTLSSASVATPSFTAPTVGVSTVISFDLVVHDGQTNSNPASVFVTVIADPAFDAGTGGDAGIDAGLADAGLADAGLADAGLADAGLADAGLADAGLADAGLADAGLDSGVDSGVDAGPLEPRRFEVGCGCSEVPLSAAWVVLGLAWFLSRRRRSAQTS